MVKYLTPNMQESSKDKVS